MLNERKRANDPLRAICSSVVLLFLSVSFVLASCLTARFALCKSRCSNSLLAPLLGEMRISIAPSPLRRRRGVPP